MKRNFLQEYLNKPMNYGGFLMRRGDVILDMQKRGFSQRCIDWYLIGNKGIDDDAEEHHLLTEGNTQLEHVGPTS